MSEQEFTHLDESGNARMVSVSHKESTNRRAVAVGKLMVSEEVIEKLKDNNVPKGNVLAVARVAGIQAAKKTSELIPLCHPLSLGSIQLDFEIMENTIEISAVVETFEKTGVEMEALVACNVAALTIYDMCKALDKEMSITDVYLAEKTGGKAPYIRRT